MMTVVMDRQMRVAVISESLLRQAALSVMIADVGDHRMVDTKDAVDVFVIELNSYASPHDELKPLGKKTPIVAIMPGSNATQISDNAGFGVVAHVGSDSTPLVLEEAIQHAARRERYVCPRLAASMIWDGGPLDLTDREQQVLRLIALGLENAEAAEEMHLSVRTIESHRSMIQKKLGTKKRRELVREAHVMGIV